MITAGDVLKKKRESLGKNLDTVSQDTKIQKRFLEYIEKNEFDRFESDVFLSGFIKIYSQYLKLDTEKVLALYRRSKPVQSTNKKRSKSNTKGKKKEKRITKEKISKIFTPRIIISISIAAFLIGIFTYIGIQIYKFQSPPQITITEPSNEQETEDPTILVKGNTTPESVLEINEHLVEIDEDGNFEKEVELNDGINTITVKARKNSNNVLETVETRKVTYNKPEETEEEKEEEKIENTLTLEIRDSSAWVRLDVDDINQVAQILEPSTEEYTVNNNFHIITGRVTNTFLTFNGDPVNWNTGSTSGVVEMSCTVKNNNIACQ